MKNLFIKNISESQVLTSYNFARNSDVVYAESLTPDQFSALKLEDYKIYHQSKRMITYKKTKFELKEGDVIFCNKDFLNNLFTDIKNIKKLKNISLVTHQNDDLITKKILSKKPKCISKWYSINVGIVDDNIIPIPLGLSNDYSPKNLRYEHFQSLDTDNKDENIKMYVNFRMTNFKERGDLYDYFSDKEWVVVKEPNSEINSYLNDLNNIHFTLCPWGNGVDSHRIWEALYAGSIPITKFHTAFGEFKNLPILFVENYADINLQLLKDFYSSYKKNKDLSDEKLNIDYWINKIKKPEIKSEEFQIIYENKLLNKLIDFQRELRYGYLSYKKIIYFYLRKFKKIYKFN